MLGLKLNHVSKRGHSMHSLFDCYNAAFIDVRNSQDHTQVNVVVADGLLPIDESYQFFPIIYENIRNTAMQGKMP